MAAAARGAWPPHFLESLPWAGIVFAHSVSAGFGLRMDGEGVRLSRLHFSPQVTWNGRRTQGRWIGRVATRENCQRRGMPQCSETRPSRH